MVDGDEDDAHYNCKTAIPDEPVTHFIEQLIKNPAIIFGLGEGKFDIPDDDEVHDYTAQVSIPASELGDMAGVEGNVTVLVESQDAAEEEVDEGGWARMGSRRGEIFNIHAMQISCQSNLFHVLRVVLYIVLSCSLFEGGDS